MNQKFTATLVHEADKAIVVALRDDIKLNEKDTMQLLIEYGMQHEDEIRAVAAERVKIEQAEREERKKASYELLKQKMQEARAMIKAGKTIEKAKQAVS